MASVDILSDDDENPTVVPAAPPQSTSEPPAPQPGGGIELLSDEDGDKPLPASSAPQVAQAYPSQAAGAASTQPPVGLEFLSDDDDDTPFAKPIAQHVQAATSTVAASALATEHGEVAAPAAAAEATEGRAAETVADKETGTAARGAVSEEPMDSDDECIGALQVPAGLPSPCPAELPSTVAVDQGVAHPPLKRDAPQEEASSTTEPAAKKAARVDAKVSKIEAKDRKLTKEEMETRVVEYMQQQNRPYNSQNVFDNLHGVVPKGQVQGLLDAFSSSGKFIVKEYGKSKVYLISQAASGETQADELQGLQAEIEASSTALSDLRARAQESRTLAGALRSRRGAAAEMGTISKDAEELESRLRSLRASATAKGALVDEGEVQQAEASLRAGHTEWKRRKNLCMAILHQFSELSGSKIEHLAEKYGIDTDESLGHLLPS